MKRNIEKFILLFLGALIGAYSFNNVLLPSSLISGGLGGIATVITRWIPANIQLVLAALCLPILVWAYITYGFIHNELKRGATYNKEMGSYNNQEKMLIKTLVSNSELVALKEYVKKADPLCFMYINQSIGVVGGGFESINPV